MITKIFGFDNITARNTNEKVGISSHENNGIGTANKNAAPRNTFAIPRRRYIPSVTNMGLGLTTSYLDEIRGIRKQLNVYESDEPDLLELIGQLSVVPSNETDGKSAMDNILDAHEETLRNDALRNRNRRNYTGIELQTVRINASGERVLDIKDNFGTRSVKLNG